MKKFKEHPITTIIGLLFVIVGLLPLFIELKKDLNLWHMGIIVAIGLLLIISEDDMKDVLKTFFTLGINKVVGKKEV